MSTASIDVTDEPNMEAMLARSIWQEHPDQSQHGKADAQELHVAKPITPVATLYYVETMR